jgi:hypothetical protein
VVKQDGQCGNMEMDDKIYTEMEIIEDAIQVIYQHGRLQFNDGYGDDNGQTNWESKN